MAFVWCRLEAKTKRERGKEVGKGEGGGGTSCAVDACAAVVCCSCVLQWCAVVCAVACVVAHESRIHTHIYCAFSPPPLIFSSSRLLFVCSGGWRRQTAKGSS